MILARHEGASYQDPQSPIYTELEAHIPSVAWRSADRESPGGMRLFFRDAREPWSSTGVVLFDETSKTLSLTPLGKRLERGDVSPSDVFVMAMEAHAENGESPFRILASSFLEPAAYHGLTIEQLMAGVMQNYRPGVDDLVLSLENGTGETFGSTPTRRFRHMLTMLETVGAIAAKDTKYIAWNFSLLKRLSHSETRPDAGLKKLIFQFSFDCGDAKLAIHAGAPLRFSASCQSKRFLILTGLAGSGKTKLAQAFAQWITKDSGWVDIAYEAKGEKPNPFCSIIPVGADWIGNENILGYADGLQADRYVSKPALELILHAEEHADDPHFLILDEMNLSHVERYFADILSIIESDEGLELYAGDMSTPDTWRLASADRPIPPKLIRLPENLFIIGTVNVDETTYMFSPKVLDRANVIEFRMDAGELEGFLANPAKPDLSKLAGKGAPFGRAFVQAAKSPVAVPDDVKEAFDAEMLLLFKMLQGHGAEFGYRTAYEAARFIHFYKLLGNFADGETAWFPKAFDCVIFQKMLPKLHGSRAKLGPILKKLWFLCLAEHKFDAKSKEDRDRQVGEMLNDANAAAGSKDKNTEPSMEIPQTASYPLSAEKIYRMWRLMMENGFASFAEA
jgi:energy-coupling factor transporter ATP-binding protein EcfA2